MPDSDLLSPGQVADTFGVHIRTLARWEDNGRLHPVRTVGGHRRYRRSEVEALRASLEPTEQAS